MTDLVHASMGPRSNDLGKFVTGCWGALGSFASMGPRSNDLGKLVDAGFSGRESNRFNGAEIK